MSSMDEWAEALRPHYARFLEGKGDTILLTAHSHQAWPDVSREGHMAAWDDAARLVDRKWERVFGAILPEFRERVAARLGSSRPDDVAVGTNTHELLYRVLSCFLDASSVLTTNAEFHSLDRQLARLAEDGLVVHKADASAPSLAAELETIATAKRPDLVLLSLVYFTSARILVELPRLLSTFASLGIPVLVDAYHGFNTLELHVDRWPGEVFVVAGGYKYAECGEGCCFLQLPKQNQHLRPSYTGWFASFDTLEHAGGAIAYGRGGARFLGSTLDPTAFYRAVWVLRFMDERGLTPARLRAQSMAQTELIISEYDALGLAKKDLELVTPRAPEARAAFVAFARDDARELAAALSAQGVEVDVRGRLLRMGPGPYTRSAEIRSALQRLAGIL